MDSYAVKGCSPDIEIYMSSRAATDLTPRALEALIMGTSNTIFGVHIALYSSPKTIAGMDRMAGD